MVNPGPNLDSTTALKAEAATYGTDFDADVSRDIAQLTFAIGDLGGFEIRDSDQDNDNFILLTGAGGATWEGLVALSRPFPSPADLP